LAAAALSDARAELRDVGASREMSQSAAQNDCSAAGVAGRADLVGDCSKQGRTQ
jgi:hypothetical protein